MPNMNIPLDASLLRAINVASAKAEMTQRDWVIWVLSVNVGWEVGNGKVNDTGKAEQVQSTDERGGADVRVREEGEPEVLREREVPVSEEESHDCPACDGPLILWTKPGPNRFKWACRECDHAWTLVELAKVGR